MATRDGSTKAQKYSNKIHEHVSVTQRFANSNVHIVTLVLTTNTKNKYFLEVYKSTQ